MTTMKLHFRTTLWLFGAVLALFHLSKAAAKEQLCGPTSAGPIHFSGAPSVQAVMQAWKTGYQSICPNNEILIQGNSSADGVARVCATRTGALPVDIGGLSRVVYTAEAKTTNGWQYECERSRRKAIKVDVAVEGISVFTKLKDSVAQACIQKLGGLTKDQLRWIYSNYNETRLVEEGWDPSSVPFLDGNEMSHLWSELHSDCADEEILLAGEPDGSLIRKYFIDNIFEGDDEEIAIDRTTGYLASNDTVDLVHFVEANGASIVFFGLGYTLQKGVREFLGGLESVAIRNGSGEYTKPGFAAIEDSSYLLARRLYMTLLDDDQSLAKTRPLFDFGFSEEGSELLKGSGFWPIHHWEAIVMTTRLQTESALPFLERAKASCGPSGRQFSIAGSSTVFPVTRIWAEVYQIACDVDITYEGGGSSVGAGRVCANLERGTPVQIGDMSREWKDSEALEHGGFVYECLQGDPERSAIQIAVAIDGLTVVAKEGGTTSKCIEILGGLTISQLRWIYSSYSDEELVKTGWDPTAVANSDGNSTTHLWSELDSRCDDVEIRISGADDLSGTYEYFSEVVLADHSNGETFASNREVGYYNNAVDELLIKYLEVYEEAISYFGYAYFVEYQDRLHAVPVQNSQGAMIPPSEESIRDGSYEPLARSIYMNLLNNRTTLKDTVPFLDFGLQSDDLVAVTGFLASPRKEEMYRRINRAPYSLDGEDSGLVLGGILTIAIGGACVLASGLLLVATRSHGRGEKVDKVERAIL